MERDIKVTQRYVTVVTVINTSYERDVYDHNAASVTIDRLTSDNLSRLQMLITLEKWRRL